MKRALPAIGLLLSLTACPPGTRLNTVTLSPTQVIPSYRQESYVGTWCGFSGLNQPGTAPAFTAPPGQSTSGFSDAYQRGSGPFPCVVRADQFFRGGPVFDLSMFDADVLATLTFAVVTSVSADGDVTGQNPPVCNATTLGMGTGTDFYNFDNPVGMPPCGQPQSVDVTNQARAWVSHSHANFGFILAGPKIDFPNPLPDDNVADVSWYGRFQLVVEYNPVLNPRAPQ
jgi:hypothetical protein